jgi:hypothetical protein
MEAWDAAVDVSNVCWDEQLPPRGVRAPVWGRLRLVLGAWNRAHASGARFDLVADAALERDLDDTREFGRLLAVGELAVVPHADTEILDLAREHSLHVLTRDRFLQHRSVHPWIVEQPERFHRWQYSGGKVTIVPLGIQRYQPPVTSPSAGDAGASQRGHGRLDPADSRYRAILAVRWECAATGCAARGVLRVLPRVTGTGEPRCPVCGGPLKARGQRGRVQAIIVADCATETEIVRLVLEPGVSTTIGSAPAPKVLGLLPYAAPEFRGGVGRLSRQHAALRVEEPRPGLRRMVVTDLWSGSGTSVVHPPGRPKPADPGREVPVMNRGQIILGGAVMLRFPP